MSESVSANNIQRYKVGYWSDEDAPFCLAQLAAYEPEDDAEKVKVERLIDGRYDPDSPDFTQICNIGKCTLSVTQNEKVGRKVVGACRAVSFCMKNKFESVRELPLDEGRAAYRDIMESTEGHVDQYNAGNFCPKLDCELSAGVSIDGHPGTAGVCRDESDQQLRIDLA